MESTETAPRTSDVRPLWIPPGVKFEKLCPSLQFALREIIGPAYRELVLAAPNGFERTAALTYVHLTWLEVVEQVDFGKALEVTLLDAPGLDGHEERIARLLRLISSKDKVAKFLLALQKFFEKAGDIDPLRRVPR